MTTKNQSMSPDLTEKMNRSIDEIRALGYTCFEDYFNDVLTNDDADELRQVYPPMPVGGHSICGDGVGRYDPWYSRSDGTTYPDQFD